MTNPVWSSTSTAERASTAPSRTRARCNRPLVQPSGSSQPGSSQPGRVQRVGGAGRDRPESVRTRSCTSLLYAHAKGPPGSPGRAFELGAALGIRTPDPFITSEVLWPTELRRHLPCSLKESTGAEGVLAPTDHPMPGRTAPSSPLHQRPQRPSARLILRERDPRPLAAATDRHHALPAPRATPVRPALRQREAKSGHHQRNGVRAPPQPSTPRPTSTTIPAGDAIRDPTSGLPLHLTPRRHPHAPLPESRSQRRTPPRARRKGFSATKHPRPRQAPPTYGQSETRRSDRFPIPVRRVISLPRRADAGLRAGAPAPPVVQSHHHRVGRHVVAHHGPRPLRGLHARPHPGS